MSHLTNCKFKCIFQIITLNTILSLQKQRISIFSFFAKNVISQAPVLFKYRILLNTLFHLLRRILSAKLFKTQKSVDSMLQHLFILMKCENICGRCIPDNDLFVMNFKQIKLYFDQMRRCVRYQAKKVSFMHSSHKSNFNKRFRPTFSIRLLLLVFRIYSLFQSQSIFFYYFVFSYIRISDSPCNSTEFRHHAFSASFQLIIYQISHCSLVMALSGETRHEIKLLGLVKFGRCIIAYDYTPLFIHFYLFIFEYINI